MKLLISRYVSSVDEQTHSVFIKLYERLCSRWHRNYDRKEHRKLLLLCVTLFMNDLNALIPYEGCYALG